MQHSLLIGLGSGVVSALLFYSAAKGGSGLGLVLVCLTPLPPLLAGLGWGWLPAASGAFAGSLALAAIGTGPLGVGYFFAVGLPAAVVAYLAYLSRPSPDADGGREWYPVGRLLAVLSLYAGALPVLSLLWIGGSFEGLRPLAAEVVQAIRQSTDLRVEPPTEEQVIAALPAAISAYWLIIMTPNLYLAGRVADASGRLGREWPDVSAFVYPVGFPLLLGLAMVAGLAPGVLGVAGASFTGALMFAHMLAGLALAHFMYRHGKRWALWLAYGGLVLLFPYSLILLAMAGVMEQALKLKARLRTKPPSA